MTLSTLREVLAYLSAEFGPGVTLEEAERLLLVSSSPAHPGQLPLLDNGNVVFDYSNEPDCDNE